jgi:hypothetical protein
MGMVATKALAEFTVAHERAFVSLPRCFTRPKSQIAASGSLTFTTT